MTTLERIKKREHFLPYITDRGVSVHPYEIGSRGYILYYISQIQTKQIIKKLHKFCKPSVGFKALCENLPSLAVLFS